MNEITKYMAVGRRKEAIARVQMVPGTGNILVNEQPYEKYFIRETDRIIIKQPLQVTNNLDKYDIIANIVGGGLTGQAGALRLGIARALLKSEPKLKDLLRKHGFLTRDPRMKERKKYGQKGARKRFQWTKR
jgi:small subunit ribosomal protein S9